jgi:MFS superfamily sulfate permease-like transporter
VRVRHVVRVRVGLSGRTTGEVNTISSTRHYRFLPILDWLAGYQRDWLRFDAIAGLTTAAVVIPKAMAYATIAGLPVQVGLYTTFLPMLIYAALGTSRPLSVSTSTTLAILVGAELSAASGSGSRFTKASIRRSGVP